jgi:signal transduction histidine kinase
LSVVKAIVDAHRGDVRVDEVPTGIGSRFVVRLPRNGHRQ